MLHEEIIPFKFKGNRQYVQGADIIDIVIKTSKDIFGEYPVSIKGSFHQSLISQGAIRIYHQDHTPQANTYHSLFFIELPSNTYLVTIGETDRPVTTSYAYDEEKVTLGMTYGNDFVRHVINDTYTFNEQLVALTKKLHLKIYPDSFGKWIFTKIQVQHAMNPKIFPGHKLMVKAKKNFHNKLTQNLIYFNDEQIGDIWFSLLPKGETK